jgi:myo-inositol-1(or 4)-monophosphatase
MKKSKELELACRVARRASRILCQGFGTRVRVEHKGLVDLVTEYDRRSEEMILSEIKRVFPEDRIWAEESGINAASGERTWYVDPLDGTTNYAHGLPIFAVSVALSDREGLRLGVIFDPTRGECFWGERGRGAYLNEDRLHVSEVMDLGESLLVTGFPYDIRSNPENNLDNYARFAVRSLGVRRLGSATLDLAYVAAGRLDGFWELRLSPWDVAAGSLLIREAGGEVTDVNGGPEVLTASTSILAANPRLHSRMLEILRRGPEE